MVNFTSNTYILKRKILTFTKKFSRNFQENFQSPKENSQLTLPMACWLPEVAC